MYSKFLHGRSRIKNVTIHPRVPTSGRGEGGGGEIGRGGVLITMHLLMHLFLSRVIRFVSGTVIVQCYSSMCV